jgi:hypothetical protein
MGKGSAKLHDDHQLGRPVSPKPECAELCSWLINPSRTADMPYSIDGYEIRAQECVKLANQATDQMVQIELLKLRQTYLTIAERLREHDVVPRGQAAKTSNLS